MYSRFNFVHLNTLIRVCGLIVLLANEARSNDGSSYNIFVWDFNFMGQQEKSMQLDYDLINKMLIDKLPNVNDAEQNLMEAMRWLQLVSDKQAKNDQDKTTPEQLEAVEKLEKLGKLEKLKRSMPSTKSLVQFTSLLALINSSEPICNLIALNILKNNEAAIGKRISLPQSLVGPLRRIDEVVHQVGLTHARHCRYNYPPKLVKLIHASNPVKLEKLTSMLDQIIGTSKIPVFVSPKTRILDSRYVLAEKARGVSMRGSDELKALLQYLNKVTRDDPRNRFLSVVGHPKRRNKWIVDRVNVEELMKNYVFENCQYMQRNFGRTLEPAWYDQQFYDRENQYRAVNYAMGEILSWLQYHRLCKEILADQSNLTNRIIKEIEKRLIA